MFSFYAYLRGVRVRVNMYIINKKSAKIIRFICVCVCVFFLEKYIGIEHFRLKKDGAPKLILLLLFREGVKRRERGEKNNITF